MSDRLLTDIDALPSAANTLFVSSMTVNAGFRTVRAPSCAPKAQEVSYGAVAEVAQTLTGRFGVISLSRARHQYLLSERDAILAGEPATAISPAWVQRKKQQLQAMVDLPSNWDSYGAQTPTAEAVGEAQVLLLWLAVAGVPPPDVFPTVDGGVQIEWHIHGLNAEVLVAPAADEARVYYHDLRTGEEWERLLSASRHELRLIRTRLLQQHAERPA